MFHCISSNLLLCSVVSSSSLGRILHSQAVIVSASFNKNAWDSCRYTLRGTGEWRSFDTPIIIIFVRKYYFAVCSCFVSLCLSNQEGSCRLIGNTSHVSAHQFIECIVVPFVSINFMLNCALCIDARHRASIYTRFYKS